jgi:hypothetical protein
MSVSTLVQRKTYKQKRAFEAAVEGILEIKAVVEVEVVVKVEVAVKVEAAVKVEVEVVLGVSRFRGSFPFSTTKEGQ